MTYAIGLTSERGLIIYNLIIRNPITKYFARFAVVGPTYDPGTKKQIL